MDLEIIILAKVSQKEKDRYHIISFICGNLKHNTNEPIYRTETDSQTERTDCGCQGAVGWEREGLRVWDSQRQTCMYRMDK